MSKATVVPYLYLWLISSGDPEWHLVYMPKMAIQQPQWTGGDPGGSRRVNPELDSTL